MKELFYPVCIGVMVCTSFVMMTDLMSIDSKYDKRAQPERVEVVKIRQKHHAKKVNPKLVSSLDSHQGPKSTALSSHIDSGEKLYPISSEKVTELPDALPATLSEPNQSHSDRFAPVTGAP